MMIIYVSIFKLKNEAHETLKRQKQKQKYQFGELIGVRCVNVRSFQTFKFEQ